jgi:hypothetical protein
MARGRKPRLWIKIDCQGLLGGSINYLFLENNGFDVDPGQLVSLACQAIWVKMIAYSEVCGGRPGWIEDNNGKGLPHPFIAQELHCPVEIFELVLDKMKEDKAIEMNGTGSIHLVNFQHYQFGEYERQQPYRLGQKEAAKVESKTDKKPYGEFANVMLSDEEMQKLVERFGEVGAKERIENLSSGIESKNYRYKSHYATILTWQRMDEKRGFNNGTHRPNTKGHSRDLPERTSYESPEEFRKRTAG